ncbi:helix-turn-helix domain-containing protein [Flavobacterium sp. TAB 87]|uniref:helix-turn-helix transcriptional regulator n=1 Tax=Flavobacterium sp. TAB 87 TaxID=1729581 RepID=UPI00076DD4A8|nr:helix-turn-helix domain-containing protein [Flavobacterium sp. TAB 87]KVV16186.1 addiction module antidote protein, HigA family [Flavobacterium sp. TAB 87]
MSNIEKFTALVSSEKTNTVTKNRERIKNRAMLRESQNIALKVLDRLEELHWTQKKLAEKLEVSPQQITKIVKGQENLTLETQIRLQNILDIPILASYFEKEELKSTSEVSITTTEKYVAPKMQYINENKILVAKKEIKLEYNSLSQKYSHFEKIA